MQKWADAVAIMQGRSEAQTEHTLPDAVIDYMQGELGLLAPSQRNWISHLPAVSFEDGLTDEEIASAETEFGFRFPSDLRAFLQTALSSGEGFPNWRSGDKAQLREWLDIPLQGILYDVERNSIWLPEWGLSPTTLTEALQACRLLVAQAPKLIPVCMHRFMPDEPYEAGNPVFSVHQTDIIHYGSNLHNYLWREFGGASWEEMPLPIRPICFWNIEGFQERWSSASRVSWAKGQDLA